MVQFYGGRSVEKVSLRHDPQIRFLSRLTLVQTVTGNVITAVDPSSGGFVCSKLSCVQMKVFHGPRFDLPATGSKLSAALPDAVELLG